jgi:hypothetical protein
MLTDLAAKRFMPLQSLTPTAISSLNVRESNHCVPFTTTTTITRYKTTATINNKEIYLHVGPSGDSWIGDAIFAAKHNQPGYVKSIALINDDNTNYKHTIIGDNEDKGSRLIEVLEEHPEWAQEIYDTECFPESLRQHLESLHEEDTKS